MAPVDPVVAQLLLAVVAGIVMVLAFRLRRVLEADHAEGDQVGLARLQEVEVWAELARIDGAALARRKRRQLGFPAA